MTTFGEIVEPSSRNVWEDWDENIHARDFVQLCWDKALDKPRNIETLLIIEGKYLSDLVKHSKDLEHINSVNDINVQLYKVKTLNCHVCLLKDYDLVLSSEIIELLKTYIIGSDEVFAILSKPLAEHHSSVDHLQDCIIRRLSTIVYSKSMTMKYLKLEQPNIISGVSAGAICWREVLNLPAAAMIFYVDQPENHDVNELCNFLQNFNIVIDKWKCDSILNSNLYI